MTSRPSLATMYPIHSKPQGLTGDKKCNIVLLRVIAGTLLFVSMIMTLIAGIYFSQPCCGDRWDNDVDEFEKKCKNRDAGQMLADKEENTERNCYKQSMVSVGVVSVALVIVVIAIILLVVAELNNTKEDSDIYLDSIRAQATQDRIDRIARRSERKEMKIKTEKYEKRAQEKIDRELSILEARRNSYPGTAPRAFPVPLQSFDGGYTHYSTQPQYIQQYVQQPAVAHNNMYNQQYVQSPNPYIYGNSGPQQQRSSRVVYSNAYNGY